MSYRILRLYNIPYTNFFNTFVNNLSNNNKNYNEIKKNFLRLKVSYSDSFSRNMNLLKNQCEEIIFNFDYLQSLWSQNLKTKKNLDIFCYQLEDFKPEVLFIQGTPPISVKELKIIKEKYKFIKKIIVHCGFQIHEEYLEQIDLLLVASPHLYDLYKKKFKNLELIYHYFDEDVLNFISDKKKNNYLLFCGKTGSNWNKDHHTRFELLRDIFRNFDIKCYSQEFSKNQNKRLSEFTFLNLILKKIIKREIFLHDHYKKNIYKPIFGLEMYNKIIESYAVLNSHVDYNKIPINYSANMRLFETTGVGTAIFTEDSKNINNLFCNNQIIIYKDKEDLIKKIRYYQNNLDELLEIGKRSQKQTLTYHSSKIRIDQINKTILNYF